MKYAVYENPHTHQFALVRLPPRFLEGDRLPVTATERWFPTKEDALGALAELFERDDAGTVN